ncbi:heavy metal translocating P-type ATPase [Paludibacterium paludis]|uniref:Copper-translocating P-type ATPase n=1 Tax=Paludibacterium paludis TaxID=1225769 RepID=A0A918P5Z5_9NEIS|nr:heavy metal translocating P-type ATPase [Paludibacterium paludis]GGY25373.1 copper-translocating P-type ATPase [Paludibacterium paludis]
MNSSCFHCGLPVPADAAFPVTYRKHEHPACCAGCQAVAQTIIDSGLGDYYNHRTANSGQADPMPDELLQQLRLYDNDDLQRTFVHVGEDRIREASLIIEGITCAACVWLNEHHLLKLPGVMSVDINYTSHRARVRWDNETIQLSKILESIGHIGYRAHPYDASRQEALRLRERKQALNRLWAAGLSMMQVMMYAVPVYLASDGEIDLQFLWMLHWAAFLLTLPVILYSCTPFYRGTWRDLKRGRVGMDTPVTLGVLTAFIASTWALINKVEHGIYFDSVSMFVFLLLGGRYLETMARRKAGEATESLVKLLPAFAHHLPAGAGGPSAELPVSLIAPGMTLLIRPGETVPADALIEEGSSHADESLLTGEGRPVSKAPGDPVVAGSLNLDSPLVVRVTGSGESTRLAAIVRLLDQALAEKPRLARIADRYAGWFVALLLLMAGGSYLYWHAQDPDRALWIMVSVLVISCPCALSLATPAALTAASGHLARLGVLVTRGHTLETLARVTDAVFDKTGTLTTGRMTLLGHTGGDEALAIAVALESGSGHPIAEALRRACPQPALSATELAGVPGMGQEGVIDGRRWRLGRADYVAQLCDRPAESFCVPGHPAATTIVLGSEDGPAACFAIGDAIRDETMTVLNALRSRGIRPHLLSGDGQDAVVALAGHLGVDRWRARATPEDKLAYVEALQRDGARVLMVGDGINDAPVLARADVSLAMGGGTDVARASGDMVLINDRLDRIPDALTLSRKTLRIIRENLWWALGYNVIALPLAVAGHVTPWIASLGMASSSLLVVSNALRLIKRKS